MQKIWPLLALSLLWMNCIPSDQVQLTFLHFNDVYEIRDKNGVGGAAMLMTALQEARVQAKNSFTIVSGDFLSPSLVSEFTKGSHMIKLFNAMHVDMVALGNHEFDFGISILRKRMCESKFAWINSNILESNKKPFAGTLPTLIKEVEGLKIGFAGILTPRTGKLSKNVDALNFIAPLKAAREAVAQLKVNGADLVVLITHLNIKDDRMLAKKVKGIDLILGGHDHIPITYYENGVLIQKSGTDGGFLGMVNLNVDFQKSEQANKILRVMPSWCMRSIYQIQPDPTIAKIVSSYSDELNQQLNVTIAKTLGDLDSRHLVVRGKESTMGDLIADALREQYQADVSLINGGSIRGDKLYPAGSNITLKDIYSELPFENTMVVIKLTGEDLWNVLEYGLSALPQLDGRFPQVSGMEVVYDPQAQSNRRIESIQIGNEPLEKNKVYRLATNDYLLEGGDGYEMLKQGEIVIGPQYGELVISSVLEYLKKHPEIDPEAPRLIEKKGESDAHGHQS